MVTRRSFLKATGLLALGSAAMALPACSGARGAESGASAASSSSASSVAEAASSTASSELSSASASAAVSGSAESAAASASAAAAANALVLYYSRAGENYGVGVIEEGNTSIVAKMIAQKTGADIFQIEPAEAYPEGYDECCDVALAEQNEGARPAFAQDFDISGYQTIYLGYPIWWGDLPMCVYTFLEAHDWAGKEIHPFCTHGGSGLSGTEGSIQSTCAGATVLEGLSIAGTTAQNSRDEAQAAVDAWLG